MDPSPAAPRRPWLAGLLNLLVPGLGSLYAGDPRWAGLSWVIGAGIGFAVAGAVLLVQPSLGVVLAVVVLTIGGLAGLGAIGWRSARSAGVPFVPTRWNNWFWYAGYSAAVMTVNNVLIAPIIHDHGFKGYAVPSPSMEPTLMVGDYLMVDRRPAARRVEFNALATFFSTEEPGLETLKRVVAVGGDTLEMRSGMMLRNGLERFDDTHYRPTVPDSQDARFASAVAAWSTPLLVGPAPAGYRPDPDNWGPIVVPQGHFFAVGDNRDVSWDSRYHGVIPDSNVTGRPRIIYWNKHFLITGGLARIGLGPQ